jgi:UDP-N-acetylmuramate dehydrogenase
MKILERVNVGAKTTMKIGGEARWFAELTTKADAEEAQRFAKEKKLPLIVLGGGANTVFADGLVEALVVRITADKLEIKSSNVLVESGKILATLINDCASKNLDLSPLTGIPGTVGGAIVGNAGQGPKGIWMNAFVTSVTALVNGAWETFSNADCNFRYRESVFKTMPGVIVWGTALHVPSKPEMEIRAEIEQLLKKRFAAQPSQRTAGSCFKATKEGKPAWQLIEAAGLRGLRIGGVQVSEKHANFLLNIDHGTFEDVLSITKKIRENVPDIEGIEMRLYDRNGEISTP